MPYGFLEGLLNSMKDAPQGIADTAVGRIQDNRVRSRQLEDREAQKALQMRLLGYQTLNPASRLKQLYGEGAVDEGAYNEGRQYYETEAERAKRLYELGITEKESSIRANQAQYETELKQAEAAVKTLENSGLSLDINRKRLTGEQDYQGRMLGFQQKKYERDLELRKLQETTEILRQQNLGKTKKTIIPMGDINDAVNSIEENLRIMESNGVDKDSGEYLMGLVRLNAWRSVQAAAAKHNTGVDPGAATGGAIAPWLQGAGNATPAGGAPGIRPTQKVGTGIQDLFDPKKIYKVPNTSPTNKLKYMKLRDEGYDHDDALELLDTGVPDSTGVDLSGRFL